MVARYAHQNGLHIQAAMDKLGQRVETTDAGKLAGSIVEKLPRVYENYPRAAPFIFLSH